MGLISYFKNKHYCNKLDRAESLIREGRAPEAEQIFISILDKQPLAVGKLAAYYNSLAPKYDTPRVIDLFKKTVDLKSKGGTVYDKPSYDREVKLFVAYINERANSCYAAKSFPDCCSLLSALNSTKYKSKESIQLCCEARIQIIFRQIESVKTTDEKFKTCIDEFKSEWKTGKSISRARKVTKEFCDKFRTQKRFYAANALLSITIDDTSDSDFHDNTVNIVFGKDVEASSVQIKDTVSKFGKNIVLRKEQTQEESISIFEACWKISHNQDFVINTFLSVKDKALRDALINHILTTHSSYLSDDKLLRDFTKLVYDKVEMPLSIDTLEKINVLGYDAEDIYITKVHTWSKEKNYDERIILLDRAQSLFPNSSIITEDKFDCAQWFLDNGKDEKAISVADSILHKSDKACLVKAHAICNLANAEPKPDKKVDLLKKSEETLGKRTGPEYLTISECISFAYLGAAEKYYSQNARDNAYDILHTLSKSGYRKALVTMAVHRLSEIRASDSVEHKLDISSKAISEIQSFNISAIAECAEFQSIWDEHIAAVINKFKTENDTIAISEFECVLKDLEGVGFSKSVMKNKQMLITKELIRRKYLVARNLELSNNLEGAIDQYKGINTLEAKENPTLSALRFVICKLKFENKSDILQHKEEIYTLLRNASDTFKAEKEDIAYRYALILLKSGEEKEALAVLNEFIPGEEHLRRACEQGDVIRAQAKLDEFNSKLDAVKNRTLSSDDAVFFINHILEYGETINPILQLTRSELSIYRNKLKNYAIFKLFYEGKYAVALDKMIKEHPDYLDDLTALRNIALICLNMAEEKQVTSSNYEEVIAIWLTAIYQEKLFIKSLDYTSWDDNFTFSLYEAYGHFNEDTIENLPDNVNFDDSDDSSVVPIREVQRALLDRFEAAISDNQQYHVFYTSQKDAMDAFIALDLAEKCRLVAPSLAKKDTDVFNDITNALEREREQERDNWEDVLSVGAIYQIEKFIYAEYRNAKSYFKACNEAINTKIVSQAKQAFASLNISSIRGFDKLFSALVSLANSKIAVLSAKEKSDFKDNFNFYMVVCDAIKDSTLSFTLSNYVMSFVVGQVNSNEMSKTEAADYILSIFFLDKANVRVKENLTTLFEMLVCEEDSKSVQVVSTILAKLQKFDEPLYQSLRMKYIHATLNLIVEKVNSGTMNKADASGQILSLYFQDRNNTHIKQNITTLFEMLAMENDSKSIQAVSSVLTKLQTFDSSLYSKLNRINEDAKIQKELKSIVNLVNNKQMTNSSALSRVYKMYSLNPDNSGICQNLAQLCSICIMEYYISGQEAGYSAVQGILDSLKTNMSQEFRKHRDVFKEQYNVIWNQLPFVTKQLLSGISIYNQSLNENGKALKRGLEYMCSLGGFSINNSEFSFPPLIHR